MIMKFEPRNLRIIYKYIATLGLNTSSLTSMQLFIALLVVFLCVKRFVIYAVSFRSQQRRQVRQNKSDQSNLWPPVTPTHLLIYIILHHTTQQSCFLTGTRLKINISLQLCFEHFWSRLWELKLKVTIRRILFCLSMI